MDIKKDNCFTLAETLITLTILGVIAVIMIPDTVRKIQDRMTVTQVKKAYSILDNALQQMWVEEGPMETWNWPDGTITNNNYPRELSKNGRDFFVYNFYKYLNIRKNCNWSVGCFTQRKVFNERYYNLNGEKLGHWIEDDNNINGKAVLNNNMQIAVIPSYNPEKRMYYGQMRIDINGHKRPNREGYDVFWFLYGSNGIFTTGDYHMFGGYAPKNCNIHNKNIHSYTDEMSGYSCSTWIIKHNNMDYKYRDVSSEW